MKMEETEFIWHPNVKLDFADFDRVHTVLVMPDSRILVRFKNGEGRITGGHIDDEDQSLKMALERELLEEINVTIDKCDYLGYLEVRDLENNLHEKWARMVARVSKIGEVKPDPDRENNWIYGRVLMPTGMAKQVFLRDMPSGDTDKIVDSAVEVAKEKNYFTEPKADRVEILNVESRDDEVI